MKRWKFQRDNCVSTTRTSKQNTYSRAQVDYATTVRWINCLNRRFVLYTRERWKDSIYTGSLLTPKTVFRDSSIKRCESTRNRGKMPSYRTLSSQIRLFTCSPLSSLHLIASYALLCQSPLLLCALLGAEGTASVFSPLFFLFSVSVFPCPAFRSIAITKYRWSSRYPLSFITLRCRNTSTRDSFLLFVPRSAIARTAELPAQPNRLIHL